MGTIGRQLLLQIVLILLNAFFAATEIAVISLNETNVRKKAEYGDGKAKKMLKMVTEPTTFLSTIQIGITLAGFLGSAFAADSFSGPLVHLFTKIWGTNAIPAKTVNTIAVVLITLILSYFTLVFGELVPKRIAMRNAEKLARGVCGAITAVSVLLQPIIWLLSVSTNGVLRLLSINPHETGEDVSEEDIMNMVDAGQENGSIDLAAKEMIENIFEFDDITAEGIMVPRTEMLVAWLDYSAEDILELIEKRKFSRIPICGESIDDIVGILYTRDFLLACREGNDIDFRGLIHEAKFVPGTTHANVLFHKMQKEKSHMFIVIDEYGGTAGLVTMEDLIEVLLGKIYDEKDLADTPDITLLDQNKWKISGNAPMDTVLKKLKIDLPSQDFNTFGGFIMNYLSYIPGKEDHPEFEAHGLRIKVLSMYEKRVKWAEVTKL
ncbi:MAG: hemolysin family protein [Bacillota bacterium]|nr:hemolysin family protein [Bacillota bacterium]